MTKPQARKTTKTAAAPAPKQGTMDERQEARARADACSQAIAGILAEYNCTITPMLNSEGVGQSGAKIMLWATYGVIPNMNVDG